MQYTPFSKVNPNFSVWPRSEEDIFWQFFFSDLPSSLDMYWVAYLSKYIGPDGQGCPTLRFPVRDIHSWYFSIKYVSSLTLLDSDADINAISKQYVAFCLLWRYIGYLQCYSKNRLAFKIRLFMSCGVKFLLSQYHVSYYKKLKRFE